ncbi:MAG TPA: NAD(P)/FAD-dependent oxidoreductase [Blastocatellia bacterium]|nr:NAD(P)/FAD-dependent oxidoreductase [Blastocatellia bacterium]
MNRADFLYDVAVVGGGIAGLSAATFAARSGNRVILLEQSNDPGGRARTKNIDGFFFNLGPHALYRGGRGIQVLSELGVEVSGKPPIISGAYAVRNGSKHAFPSGFMSLLTTSLFGAGAKFEAAKFLASLFKIETRDIMGVTLGDWVDSNILHHEVREFFHSVFRISTYSNAPRLMSAGTALRQLQLAFTKNVLYLDGGWQSIVDGLGRAALNAGVTIETGSRVQSIDVDQTGLLSGLQLASGTWIDTRSAIIAASPEVAAALAGERAESLKRFAAKAIPVRVSCLDIALRRLPKPRALYAFGMDQPFYMSVHSASARLAPEGGALIQLAKYLSPDDSEGAGAEVELEGALDLIQPGWRNELVYRRFLPDMIVTNALTEARSNGTEGRPSVAVDEVPGLYIAGDWVGPEGLLADASLASARQAAESAIATRAEAVAV